MSSSDLAISVRGLGKSYSIRHNATDAPTTLAESIMRRVKRPFARGSSQRETFWALKDVNFEVKKGEVVGIIGRNGAGKSTLLKILSRITEPTTGEIDLYGSVGSLLEVGTGFHQELTGRENIYLNGSILGMRRREIDGQFDAIVDFAGVEQFLDTPVKRYSSGMYVRLAFAVAAQLRSDILIVDEVLAVGDAEFQRRCLGKMRDVAQLGRTVIVVSHNLGVIASLCTRGIVLNAGRLDFTSTASAAIQRYSEQRTAAQPNESRLPDSPVVLLSIKARQDELDTDHVDTRRPIVIRVHFCVSSPVQSPRYFIELEAASGEPIFGTSSVDENELPVGRVESGEYTQDLVIPADLLKTGDILIHFGVDIRQQRLLARYDNALRVTVFDGLGDSESERHSRPGVVAPVVVWRKVSSEGGDAARKTPDEPRTRCANVGET